jgi:ribosomal protein S12 methylthiotransferase accessory factor
LPVFQAVRPASRALSVHLGKALTRDAAMLGALMEAVESHHAEGFAAETRVCAWSDLPPDERSLAPDDFASRRDALAAGDSVAWTAARRLDGGTLWVPFESVSLDLGRRGDLRIERSSNGQAAHFDVDAARKAALLELLERDALAAWMNLPQDRRASDRIAVGSIPFDWLQRLCAAGREAGLIFAVYALPSLLRLPAFLAEIIDLEAGAAHRGAVYGTASHPELEGALAGAVFEAAQSRAAAIAGARDDLLYRAPSGGGFGVAPPLPPHMTPHPWSAAASGFDEAAPADLPALAAALARAGYAQTAFVDLAAPDAGVSVVKAFAPGLGAFERRRRKPVDRP